MKIILNQKQSNSGSIHSVHSADIAREIVFGSDCKFAVICASYYGGKGYTTHKTIDGAYKAARKLSNKKYSYQVYDTDGNNYALQGIELLNTGFKLDNYELAD